MLELSGNSKYAFANRNSINANPVVWAEWNYNALQRPYAIASSSVEISTSLSNDSNWTPISGVTTKAKYVGYQSDINPTASAVNLKLSNTLTDHFTSGSITVTKDYNSYYKLVFYVKADHPINSTTNLNIPANDLYIKPSAPGTDYTAYYRIMQVTKNGAENFPNYDYLDIKDVGCASQIGDIYYDNYSNKYGSNINAYNTVHWDILTYGGPLYNIYFGLDRDNLSYVDTIGHSKFNFDSVDSSSYTDGTMKFYFVGSMTTVLNNGMRFVTHGMEDSYDFSIGSGPSAIQNLKNKKKFTNIVNNEYWEVLSFSGSTDANGDPQTVVTASPVSSSIVANKVSEYQKRGILKLTGSKMTGTIASFRHTMPQDILLTGEYGPVKLHSTAIRSDKIRFTPNVMLYNSGNLLESTRSFIKVYDTEFSDPEMTHGMIELDGVNYKKVEVYFGSREKFGTIVFDLGIDSSYKYSSVLLCQPKLYKIDNWEFLSTETYPIDSLFNSHRPGEALLNPYLSDSDRTINPRGLSPTAASAKPISFAAFDPDFLHDLSTTQPYKQIVDNHMNNVMRYYVSSYNNNNVSVRADYNKAMNVNKIVIKGSSAFLKLRAASGSVILLQKSGSVVIPFTRTAFDDSGLMDLYYDGLSWSTTIPASYPPKLTDSGILQNVVQDVTGIVLNIHVGDIPKKNTQAYRVHLIEISPRLEIDISNLIEGFSINQAMDDADSAAGFPMSYINSNTGNLTINNVPVYRDSFPITIFDDMAENATFYDLMRQGVKFTGAIVSPQQDFTDTVPMFTMYADTWSISDIKNITVSMFDAAKQHLMAMQAPDYFGENETMFNMITNIMDAVGFSDYDYDGLRELTKRKSQGTSHFWCDRGQTIFETLQSYFAAHQIGAFFDAYGIMRFTDIDKIIDGYLDNKLSPVFAVTDIPLEIGVNEDEVNYIPNIIENTYSHTLAHRVGKVSVEYQVPIKAFTDDVNFSKSRQSEQKKSVWEETGYSALIYSWSNKSVPDDQSYFWSVPNNTVFHTTAQTPRYTLGSYQNTAFLQGELIKWNGFEYTFSPYTTSGSAIVDAVALVQSASPFKSTASISITSTSAVGSNNIKTGWQINGDYISEDTYVTKITTKRGPRVTVSGSISSGTIFITTASSASTVGKFAVVTGPGIQPGTYTTGEPDVSAPSVLLKLSKKPSSTKPFTATFQSSSMTLQLSASPTIVGTASTAASVQNYSLPFSTGFYHDNASDVNTPNAAKSLTAIISDASELQNVVMDYSNEDTRITGITYDFTGRVSGLSRGEYFTSKRDHLLLDDQSASSGFTNSNLYFNKKIITSSTSIGATLSKSNSNSTIIFDNNVASFIVKRSKTGKTYPAVLTAKRNTAIGSFRQPASASSFNYYSFLFSTKSLANHSWGSDTRIIELGLFMETDQGNLMFCLANDKNVTYLKSNVDLNDNEQDLSTYVFGESYLGSSPIVSASSNGTASDPEWKRKVKNVFDGKVHRFSVLFHNSNDSSDMAQPSNSTMQYQYVTFMIDGHSYGPYKTYHIKSVTDRASGKTSYKVSKDTIIPTNNFGFYARNTNSGPKRGKDSAEHPFAIKLREVYATCWWDNFGHQITKGKLNYHWLSPVFLNKIIARKPDAEPPYFFWGTNKLTGVKIYNNVPFTTSPINEKTLELHYDGYDPGNDTSTVNTRPTLGATSLESISHSVVSRTPFRTSFAVVNSDDQLVYLSADGGQIDNGSLTPMAMTATYNKLTDPIKVEKVIDASALGNSIQLSTKWIQTQHDATRMLEKVGFLANTFNNEVGVTIFGNPLIQVGDLCQFVYSLKNIGYDPFASGNKIIKKVFMVKAVNQNFSSGLTTELTLKPLFHIPQ